MELQAKIALARLVEAHVDLQAAKSLAKKLQGRSLFHSQQCVEKALKACLSRVVIGEIRIHPVVKLLKEKIVPVLPPSLKKKISLIEEEAFWVERKWIDTRYEEVGAGGEIIIPVLKFKDIDARRGIVIAQKTLSWATACVNYLFKMKLPRSYSKLLEMAKRELS